MARTMRAVRSHAAALVAIVIVVSLYFLGQLPDVTADGRGALAGRFRFEPLAVPELANGPFRTERPVNPNLKRLSAWMSSLGSGITVADVDGDGLANDLIRNDPRTDLVTVFPAPGTPARYAPFSLDVVESEERRHVEPPLNTMAGDFNEDGLTDIVVAYAGRIAGPYSCGGPPPDRTWVRPPSCGRSCVPPGEKWMTMASDPGRSRRRRAPRPRRRQLLPPTAPTLLDAKATAGAADARLAGPVLQRRAAALPALAGRGPAERSRPSRYRRVERRARRRGRRAAGRWPSAPPTSTATCCPRSTSPTTSGRTGCCTTGRRPGKLRFAVCCRASGRCTTPRSSVLGRDSFKGMGVDFGDLNGDGVLDIFVSNISSQLRAATRATSSGSRPAGAASRMTRRHRTLRDDASEALGLSRSGWGWDVAAGRLRQRRRSRRCRRRASCKGTVNRWPEVQELRPGQRPAHPQPPGLADSRPGARLQRQRPQQLLRARPRTAGSTTSRPTSASTTRWQPRHRAGGRRRRRPARLRGRQPVGAVVPLPQHRPRPGAFLGLHLRLPGRTAPVQGVRARRPSRTRARPAGRRSGRRSRSTCPTAGELVGQVDGGSGHNGRRSADLHFGLGRVDAQASLPVTLKWRDNGGQAREATLRLAPGWHTVLLGGAAEPAPVVADAAGARERRVDHDPAVLPGQQPALALLRPLVLHDPAHHLEHPRPHHPALRAVARPDPRRPGHRDLRPDPARVGGRARAQAPPAGSAGAGRTS